MLTQWEAHKFNVNFHNSWAVPEFKVWGLYLRYGIWEKINGSYNIYSWLGHKDTHRKTTTHIIKHMPSNEYFSLNSGQK